MTSRVVKSQNPPPVPALCRGPPMRPFPMNGRDSRFTLGPRSMSTAGNNVSVATNSTITTRTAPRPSERKNAIGTMNSPNSAITTVTPLKSTVRPAVAPVRSTASATDRPLPISLRKREIMISE